MLALTVVSEKGAMNFREFLSDRGLTVRGFARLMAEADDDVSVTNFERWRQNAYRWGRGASVSPELAVIVADRLGIAPDDVLALNPRKPDIDASVLDRMGAMEAELKQATRLLDELLEAIRQQRPEPPANQR